MGRTVAIIQARMGSTRLPEKVLREIGDRAMLWHVYERAVKASLVDAVVVATTTEPGDDAIEAFCREHAIDCHRGSETDVLDRYYQTAIDENADTVVRLTADCPFLSPAVIDRVVRVYRDSDAQYVTNIIQYTYPDGLDVEVFDAAALGTARENATSSEEREHVTPYIRESGAFETKNVENPLDIYEYSCIGDGTVPRWTVDYPEDLEFVREVYDRLTGSGHWIFDQQSVFELLEREPELRAINDDR